MQEDGWIGDIGMGGTVDRGFTLRLQAGSADTLRLFDDALQSLSRKRRITDLKWSGTEFSFRVSEAVADTLGLRRLSPDRQQAAVAAWIARQMRTAG